MKKVRREIEEIIGIDVLDVVIVSGKFGFGVIDILECIVRDVKVFEGDFNEFL